MNGEAIGALRHRLILESVVRTPDGGGGVSESWVAQATLWGRLQPLGGGEGVEAGRLAGRHRYAITIRHRDGVGPSMRFRKGARIFHILSVENVEERGRWLRAVCEEREL